MEFHFAPAIVSTMKRALVLLTLLVTMTLALSAGKASKTSSATVIVSCSVCTVGEPMAITGTNFVAHQRVTINMSGPNGLSMSVTAGSRGTFSVDYPTGMDFAPGYYTLTASQSGGAWATTGFELQ
jgi:hypothetical protein